MTEEMLFAVITVFFVLISLTYAFERNPSDYYSIVKNQNGSYGMMCVDPQNINY